MSSISGWPDPVANKLTVFCRRSVVFADTDALPARERREQSLIDNASETALVKEVSARGPVGPRESATDALRSSSSPA